MVRVQLVKKMMAVDLSAMGVASMLERKENIEHPEMIKKKVNCGCAQRSIDFPLMVNRLHNKAS